jgi:hypothetical protein
MFRFGASRTPQVISSRDRRLAWMVAIAADAIQIVALPLFAAGGISPMDTIVDFAAGIVLCKLVGWHWAFLPAVLAELIPGLDLIPTWTASVYYVMRNRPTEDVIDIVAVEPTEPGSLKS